MRRDLQPLQDWDEIAVDLKILTARRYDPARGPSTDCRPRCWSTSPLWSRRSTTPRPRVLSCC
ncbi:hypothetical protein ACFYYX_19910 [Streptomyces phaeochromogenes]|uniref:hypothetical protein n=1 Tax=Streptomyces phaeochromogenes TaxID=1923 RepID=UPI003695F240